MAPVRKKEGELGKLVSHLVRLSLESLKWEREREIKGNGPKRPFNSI